MTGFGRHDQLMTRHPETSTAGITTTTDPRTLFGRAVATASDTVTAVRPEQLDSPTPCHEFDVRTLLGHVVDVVRRVEAMGRGEDPFGFEPVRADEVAAGAWPAALAAAADAAREAWADDAAMERQIVLPWKQGPGRDVLRGYVEELTVHTWDLGRAIGFSPAWDDEVLAVSYAAIQEVLPGAARQAMFEQVKAQLPEPMRSSPPPFADAVPVADDAPLIDRLVAWTGRQP